MIRYFDYRNPAVIRLFIGGVVNAAIMVVLTIASGKLVFPWGTPIFLGVALVVGILSAVRNRGVEAAYPSSYEQLDQPKMKSKNEVYFCADCGAKYITFERQSGFDPKTGEPRMIKTQACPKWTSRGSRVFLDASHPSYYACGNPKVTANVPVARAHTDHRPIEPSTTCPGCIEDMVTNGVLERGAANQLLKMIS